MKLKELAAAIEAELIGDGGSGSALGQHPGGRRAGAR